MSRFASSDAGQVIGPVTDNGDGTYSATITASITSGAEVITATDESATPKVSGHATLTQTSSMPPEVTLIFSRTELSAADHSSGGEFGSLHPRRPEHRAARHGGRALCRRSLSERAPGW